MDSIEQAVDLKSVLLTAIGVCIEWFDFSIYMFMAPYLAQVFFPEKNHLLSLLATFGVFAVGYIARPLGGIFFGHLGDKVGRRRALLSSILLMIIPMFVMIILPSYQTWGITASIILLAVRALQGFSIGGEYTSVLVLLVEQSPPHRRGFVTSFISCISSVGILLSSLITTILLHFLTHQQLLAWGWRVPFVAAFILMLFVLFCQYHTKESPGFLALQKSGDTVKQPLLKALKYYPKEIFFVFILVGFLGIAYYICSAFVPTYLISIQHFASNQVMIATTLGAFCYALFSLVGGVLADWIGRKIILVSATLLLTVFAYPFFYSLSQGHFYTYYPLYMIVLAIDTSAFTVYINELFPIECRSSGVSMGYNVGNAIFGGTTPLVATYLIKASGNHLAPGIYLAVAGLITVLIIAFKMTETLPMRLSTGRQQTTL